MKNSLRDLWQEVTAGKLSRYVPFLLLAVLVLSIPLTVYISGKQQQTQQHASGPDYPTGYSLTISPSSADPTSNTAISTSVSSNAESGPYIGFRRYIYYASTSTSQPVEGTPSIPNTYSPSMFSAQSYYDKIIAIDSSPSVNLPPFATPTKSGTYYVLLNVYGTNGDICDWHGILWRKDGTKGTCINSGEKVLTVTTGSAQNIPKISVDKLTPNPIQGGQLSITASGTNVGSIAIYLFKSTNSSAPTINGTYPTNADFPGFSSMNAGQFYKLAQANGSSVTSQTITIPNDGNSYYTVANAHTESLSNWWTPKSSTNPAPDYVCSWETSIYVNTGTDTGSNENITSAGSCSNPGPVALTVGSGSTSGSYPNNIGLTLNSYNVSTAGNGSVNASLTGDNATKGWNVYISKGKPSPGSTTQGVYDPGTIGNSTSGTIYSIVNNVPSLQTPRNIPAPGADGTYYVFANGYSSSGICDWNEQVWDTSSGTAQKTSNTCTNTSMKILYVGQASSASLSVDSITISPAQSTYTEGQTDVTVQATGQGNSLGLYIIKTADGNPPVVSKGLSYSPSGSYPGGSLTPDQMYLLNAANGTTAQATITLPPDDGTYYLVANAHSQSTNSWWANGDQVCTWMGNLASGTPGNITLSSTTCSNASPVSLTIGPAPSGAPVTSGPGGPPGGPGGPPGGPGSVICGYVYIPFVCPSVTPTTAPSGSPTNTPTPTPATPLAFTIYLHGIGSAGDNANPNDSTLSNKRPLHTDRSLTASLFDTNNQQVAQKSGTITYDPANGDFTGTVGFDSSLQSGSYTVKVKTDQFLTRRITGIQTITAGQTNTLPSATLVAGDVNNDDVLNALDYNTILGCYSDTEPPTACDSATGWRADLNDDGKVNQVDYNLFLRELSVKNGD